MELYSLSDTNVYAYCTGSLVAPNLVLTARHCISAYVEGQFTCDANGNLVSGPGGTIGAQDTPGNISVRGGTANKPTAIAKGVQVFSPLTTTICIDDIALVLIDQQLTDLPIMPIRLTTGTEPGEQVRVVGYGVDQDSAIGVRHTLSGLTIAEVGTSQFRPVGDPIPPRTFLTVGPALCIGDSGGPALSDNNAIIGVFSEFDSVCTAPNAKDFYTQVAPYMNDIVLPAFAAAGYEPWLEGNSEPGLYGTGGSTSAGGDSSNGGTSAVSAAGGAGGVSIALGGAPAETGGDTSGVQVYDQAPPSGGNCACRTTGSGRRGLAVLLAASAMLGLRRRWRD